MKRLLVFLAICILVVILTYGAKYLYDVKEYKYIMSTLEIKKVDLSKIKDGIYVGNFSVRFIEAETRVTIRNGKITNIELLKHKNERGRSAESIVQRVISNQSIDVDVISGATNSSKVILKSIENALEAKK